jgi:trans-2,3-dihydro-3-hydroxyanthranilate isomerase
MDLRYHVLDVFTDRPFGGNPLAVFPAADAIPEQLLQQIACEFNLSETVFVLRPRREGAHRRLRIFTPRMELPFAGHPTIGAAILLADGGLVTFAGEQAAFTLEEDVGLIRITVRRRRGQPTFAELSAAQLPEVGPPTPPREELARLLGIAPADLAGSPDDPQAVSCGVAFLFIPVRNREVLARARLDLTEWSRSIAGFWAPHFYVFCRDPELPGSDLRARMFAPALGISEDPATGGAVAALAGYVAARAEARSGTLRWTVEQGFEMGRPSLLQVECQLDAGTVRSVRVGGTAVPLMDGMLRLP